MNFVNKTQHFCQILMKIAKLICNFLQNYPPIDVRLIIEKARQLSTWKFSKLDFRESQKKTYRLQSTEVTSTKLQNVNRSALVEYLRCLLDIPNNSVILQNRKKRPRYKYLRSVSLWLLTEGDICERYSPVETCQTLMLSFLIESPTRSIPWHIYNVIFA